MVGVLSRTEFDDVIWLQEEVDDDVFDSINRQIPTHTVITQRIIPIYRINLIRLFIEITLFLCFAKTDPFLRDMSCFAYIINVF